MPESRRRRRKRAATATPSKARPTAQYLIDDATAQVALELSVAHPELTDGGLAAARTAVRAAIRLLPKIMARGHHAAEQLDPNLTDPAGRRTSQMTPQVGDSYTAGNVLVDTSRAILLGDVHVALVDAGEVGGPGDQAPLWAIQLGGRVNQTPETVSFLYIAELDGAATIIAELMALGMRAGVHVSTQLSEAVNRQINALPTNPERNPRT